jgi:hypothetical protein
MPRAFVPVLCAMLLDRLVQGRNGNGDKRKGRE